MACNMELPAGKIFVDAAMEKDIRSGNVGDNGKIRLKQATPEKIVHVILRQ